MSRTANRSRPSAESSRRLITPSRSAARSWARANRAAERRRGLTLEHTACQFQPEDFDRYDLVLVADELNLRRMHRLARSADDGAKLHLIREFDPDFDPLDGDVPDPWYGGEDGFVHVYDVIEASCRGLLEHLR